MDSNKVHIINIKASSLFFLNFIVIFSSLFFLLILSKILSYNSTIEILLDSNAVFFFKNQYVVFLMEVGSILFLSIAFSMYFVISYKVAAKLLNIYLIIKNDRLIF